MPDRRNAQHFNPDTGKWEDIVFRDIKKGMVFRLWETKLPILVNDGESSVWVALCDAYLDYKRSWCDDCYKIETEPLKNWVREAGEMWGE